MKIAVRYQSRGGNTKAVAEIIAEVANVVPETLDIPLSEYTDVLFLGGGVYAWNTDEELTMYLQHLNSKQIGMIVDFSTAGGMGVTSKKIRKYAQKAGIKICNKGLCLKILLQGHSALKQEGGHLKEKQITIIQDFTKNILAQFTR